MSNIKSFDDLREGGDDDQRKHNDYYAGGEKSGQLIRGADDDEEDEDENEVVANLFQKARQHGAVDGSSSDFQPSAFQGSGRTLAGTPAAAPAAPSGPTLHVITFYRNGVFTVDEGPARSVQDPANEDFIKSISRGECPEELEASSRGAPVEVRLVRKEEDYKEPEKPKYQAFAGSGRTLAGPSQATTSGSSAPPVAAVVGVWEGVNESLPVTSLQLRLADGSRAVARFNHTHTVTDICRFIRASRPDITWPYQLMTAFPNKLIEDENQTLEAAGLLNAVIIQKKT